MQNNPKLKAPKHSTYAYRNKTLLRLLADILTFARLLSVIPIVLAIIEGSQGIVFGLICIGAFTDIADGWLARRSGGGTSLGAKLDPLSDKVLLTPVMISVSIKGIIPLWAVILFIIRELVISIWRSKAPKGGPASKFGKYKTFCLFVSLLCITYPCNILSNDLCEVLLLIGYLTFFLAFLLAFYSAIKYISSETIDHQM